jgi:hypothetical protein
MGICVAGRCIITQDELVQNLQIIINFFEQRLKEAETTEEYTEYHIAITTLQEALQRIMTMTSLGYALRMLQRVTDGS